MARKTIDEKIAELKAKQMQQELRTRARAELEELKTGVHMRDYRAALDTMRVLHGTLEELARRAVKASERATQPLAPEDDKPIAPSLAEAVDAAADETAGFTAVMGRVVERGKRAVR